MTTTMPDTKRDNGNGDRFTSHQHPDTIVQTYPERMRFILILVILSVSLTGYLFPRGGSAESTKGAAFAETVETFDIPPTQQFTAPPPPSRPSIPVESDDEDLAEDITIDETELDDFEWDAPPPPPDDGRTIKFVPYEVAPMPIGGFAAILKNLKYPVIAQEAGIEGRVVVQALIGRNGRVLDTMILSGIPGTGMDESAVRAIRSTRFAPARQRDKPVEVWIAIPVVFKLSN